MDWADIITENASVLLISVFYSALLNNLFLIPVIFLSFTMLFLIIEILIGEGSTHWKFLVAGLILPILLNVGSALFYWNMEHISNISLILTNCIIIGVASLLIYLAFEFIIKGVTKDEPCRKKDVGVFERKFKGKEGKEQKDTTDIQRVYEESGE